MPKRTKSYHAWLLQRLSDPTKAKRYLKQAIEDSPEMFLKGLRKVAEARGMSRVAEMAGLNRESLYRALSETGNPEYDTLNSLLAALGIKLTVELEEVSPPTPPAIGKQILQDVNGAIVASGKVRGLDLFATAPHGAFAAVLNTMHEAPEIRPREFPIWMLQQSQAMQMSGGDE